MKCDGRKPVCGFCDEHSTPCVFQNVEKKFTAWKRYDTSRSPTCGKSCKLDPDGFKNRNEQYAQYLENRISRLESRLEESIPTNKPECGHEDVNSAEQARPSSNGPMPRSPSPQDSPPSDYAECPMRLSTLAREHSAEEDLGNGSQLQRTITGSSGVTSTLLPIEDLKRKKPSRTDSVCETSYVGYSEGELPILEFIESFQLTCPTR